MTPLRASFYTLGCRLNQAESDSMAEDLSSRGFQAAEDGESPDVVVINTCGFIDNAKQESIDTILRYVDAKEEGIVDKVYVTGCLSQRYKDDLEKEIPQVDAWLAHEVQPAAMSLK